MTSALLKNVEFHMLKNFLSAFTSCPRSVHTSFLNALHMRTVFQTGKPYSAALRMPTFGAIFVLCDLFTVLYDIG